MGGPAFESEQAFPVTFTLGKDGNVPIAEPAVTLTDFALTLECAAFAWAFQRGRQAGDRLGTWFVVFFCAAGLAALAGGITHGFLVDDASLVHGLVWDATLLAIGVTALAAWMIGARLVLRAALARGVRTTALTLFVAYAAAVASGVDTFLIAISAYLPAALFLLAVFGTHYVRTRRPAFLPGMVGVALTFVAAGVQQAGIGLHPVWFDHNALYHIIQAAALWFLFCTGRGLVSGRVSI